MQHTDRIATVEFGLLGPDEIRKRSVVEVKTKQIYEKNLPLSHGLNDHRMGTVDRRYRCGTCRHDITTCGGHYGHIELGYAIYHIGYLDVVRKILSSVCFACSGLLTDKVTRPDPDSADPDPDPDADTDTDAGSDTDADAASDTDTDADADADADDDSDSDTDMDMDTDADVDVDVDADDPFDSCDPGEPIDQEPDNDPASKVKGKLSRVYEQARKCKQCPHCGHPMPRYVKRGLTLDAVWRSKDWDALAQDPDTGKYKWGWESEEEVEWATRTFTPHVAYNILRGISNRTVQKLGFRVRPEHMMILVLPVPPPTMRPTIMATEGSRERGQNDLTSMLQDVVKNALKVRKQLVALRNLKKTDPADGASSSKKGKSKKKKTKTKVKPVDPRLNANASVQDLLDYNRGKLEAAAESASNEDMAQLEDDSQWVKDYSLLRYPQFAREWDLARKVPGGSVMDVDYIPEFKPLVRAREELQMSVTAYMNNDVKGVRPSLQRSGMLKKSLTKRIKSKEGRIRGNLMGKRVNFSARTVISPDPNVDIDQVGVPETIALQLHYPERVTHFNLEALTRRVQLGHKRLDGASHIETDSGRLIQLRFFGAQKPPPPLQLGWIVHRYLQDEDLVLFNRQPSLHKESMMGHRVKILRGVRTFRMNVMVAAPYNADKRCVHKSVCIICFKSKTMDSIIYLITCNINGKRYVGQTSRGLSYRFARHCSSKTKLGKAIDTFGKDAFTMQELERCSVERANEREQHFIDVYDTIWPNGYNKQTFSRSKHTTGNISFSDALSAEIKGVKRNGVLHHVYVYVTRKGKENKTRLTFGSASGNFSQALQEARTFCLKILPSASISEHNSLKEGIVIWWPYKEKVEQFDSQHITKIRINLFLEHLVRIYITTDTMTKWSQQKILTFGGKTICLSDAFTVAESVVHELLKRHKNVTTVYDDRLSQFKHHSPQQVAAGLVGAVDQTEETVETAPLI